VITCFRSFYCTIRGPQFPGFSVSLKKRSLHFSDAQATNYFRHPRFRLLCKKQGDFDKECLLLAFCSIKKRARKGWFQPTGFKKTRFFRVREFQNCWENSWTPCSEDACLFVFFSRRAIRHGRTHKISQNGTIHGVRKKPVFFFFGAHEFRPEAKKGFFFRSHPSSKPKSDFMIAIL